VIVVDDRLATGFTVRAGTELVRHLGARRVVLAVSVAPRETLEQLRAVADEAVALETPDPFFGIGQFYLDFAQADVVNASGLGNPKGFIEVKDTYQTLAYPNMYAVGIGAAVNAPWQTANAVGVPKTGFPDLGRQDAAAAPARCDDPRPAEPRGEDRAFEKNFPVEDEERLREAAVST
jgi:Phosphoribosyl transferase domain